MRIPRAAIVLSFHLCGCTTPASRPQQAPASAAWSKGDFRVRFQAGPEGQDRRTYSFYDITYQAAGREERSLVMASAHTLGGFASVTNSDPRNWIRVIADPGGQGLLIEEEIPNDCGPCANYLWVHPDGNGFIEGAYLRLPSKVTGPLIAPVNEEYPRVQSLNIKTLRYRYSTGDTVTAEIDAITKADQPILPG